MRSARATRVHAVLVTLVILAVAACNNSGEPDSLPTSTSSLPAIEGAAEVWAVGDGPANKPETRAVAELIADSDPDRLLFLGDVYGNYAEMFQRTYGVHGLEKITLPTAGNHDWPSQREQYFNYWAAALGRPISAYYRTSLGGWEVISLNSEEESDEDSEQYRWLEQVLQGPGDCRLVFMHRARFSAGQHGDQKRVDDVWELLAGRATLVLAGHDHTMQEMKPVDGITEIISGAGGKSHYRLDFQDPRLAFGDNTHDGALELHLSPGKATYRFVAVGGKTLRAGRVSCDRG